MVDFSQCPIDPAPLQLVQGTSLMKVSCVLGADRLSVLLCDPNNDNLIIYLFFLDTYALLTAWSASVLCNVFGTFDRSSCFKRG